MIRVSKIKEDAILPTRKHVNDAGMDLYAYGDHFIKENDIKIIPTAIKINLPKGYVGLIWPKSRSNYLIGGGVIDEGYQGEILVKIINLSGEDIYLSHGTAIAQFLIQPCYTPEIIEVPEKELFTEESSRGVTGGILTQFETNPFGHPDRIYSKIATSGGTSVEYEILLKQLYESGALSPDELSHLTIIDTTFGEETETSFRRLTPRGSNDDEDDFNPLIGYNGEMED